MKTVTLIHMLYVSTIWTSDTELMLSTYIVTPTLTGSPENQRVTANQRHMQKGLRSLNFYKKLYTVLLINCWNCFCLQNCVFSSVCSLQITFYIDYITYTQENVAIYIGTIKSFFSRMGTFDKLNFYQYDKR